MRPFEVETPPEGPGARLWVVALLVLVGIGSLTVGIYLGVNDLIERRHAQVSRPTDAIASSMATTTSTTTATMATDPVDTMVLTDDSGRLSVTIPVAWSDTSGGAWSRAGTPAGIQVSAAPDLAAWQSGWATPGVFVGVSDSVAMADVFGDWSDTCTRDLDEVFTVDGLAGTMQRWVGCGAEGSTFLVAAAAPDDGSFVLVYQAVILTEADRIAAERVVATLSYQR